MRRNLVMERVGLLALLSCFISFSIFLKPVISADTITPSQPLISGQTLASSSGIFELGFFSPGTSENMYLGIWYKTTPKVAVWVANRNDPLSDAYGELVFGDDGNLVLLNRTRGIVWSASLIRVVENQVAQLLDSGNLVVGENDGMNSESYLWQSFDYPTDTLLAGMKLGWDLKTGLERSLTSWKSVDDPSTGDYSYKMDVDGLPQLILAAGSTRKFRTGTWNGVRFSGVVVTDNTVFGSITEFSESESYYMFVPIMNSIVTRIIVSISGSVQRQVLQTGSFEWDIMYFKPYEQCDNYGICGANSICGNSDDSNPICHCLEGFAPSSQEEWEVLKWSKGCVRKMPLDCRKGEGFGKLVGVKLPDLLEFRINNSMSLERCKEDCLRNCSCKAYARSNIRGKEIGCLMWFGDLIDIREMKVKGSDDVLYIRLSASEIKSIHEASKRQSLIILIVVLTTFGMTILGLVFWCIIWRLKKRVRRDENKNIDIDLPLFDLATIATATNNFSDKSRIGEGGFGPVYKGRLCTGQEIAVKRLSHNSGQGLQEFKNEVVLISKLQHRNLVVLLGCCVKDDERMLIYEYMCNKSLNQFIFDRRRIALLNWEKRFSIVMGIARGLLYLHQDSKLQIIHRDLKPSNILLDDKMDPKISDFGLARTFGGEDNETKTKRVVGTYGYMSPEYAIDGKFSIKSDIFSFGVILLEIISGRRNRGFSHPDHHHNLLGHAWLLWNEERALELLTDTSLKDRCVESQVLRCVHVGLLCVQNFAVDRPTMASVVFMLANERAELPRPKQPAFFVERSSIVDVSKEEESHSRNEISTVSLGGR